MTSLDLEGLEKLRVRAQRHKEKAQRLADMYKHKEQILTEMIKSRSKSWIKN